MEAHIVTTLQNMGTDTRYFSMTGKGLYSPRISRILEKGMTDLHLLRSIPVETPLLAEIDKFRPDVILVLLGNYTTPSTIRKLRNVSNAKIVCWCQDHMGTMGRQYIIGSGFDFIFAKDQLMVDRFRAFTEMKQVHYLPEACNPGIHRPVSLGETDKTRFGCDVTTAATLYYYRSEILSSLTGFDMKIWGPVPRYYDGPLREYATGQSVYARDKSACFNASRIVVNTLFPMEIGGLNARAFEIAGCGGFQLITYSEAVARHFEPGKEIETFRNLAELHDKVCYYLKHEDARRAIAEAGQRRAHNEHTYEHRLREMFEIISL